MPGQIYLPQRIEMDVQETFTEANAARYIKNLIHAMGDTSLATTNRSGKGGVYKNLESNAVYVNNWKPPPGTVQAIGRACFRQTRQAFLFTYSTSGNHGIFRINGDTATIQTVAIGPFLNFQLDPRYFINSDGGCFLEEIIVADPVTSLPVKRTFLFFTDAFNDQGFVCVDDAIATGGFNPVTFPFFQGTYDINLLFRMGTMTPNDCIQVSEIQLTQTTDQLSNDLLYNTWQFRLRYIDVWGKPSEYGIISDMYIPGGGGCIQSSSNLARCLSLMFLAPPPHINQIEVAYRNCNSTQWHTADFLDLYVGVPLGEWWTRPRNPEVKYNAGNGTITYVFCADAGDDPIDPNLTNRLNNELPIRSNSVAPIGSFTGLGGNQYGRLPFSKSLLDQFKIVITPPSETPNSARMAEIFVEIFSPFNNSNQPIYSANINGKPFFGFGDFLGVPGTQTFTDYKQYFINPNQQGFIGLLAGTGAYVVSQQYVMDINGNFTEVLAGQRILLPSSNNVRYFQKFTFTNLSPQTYVFRIIDHQTDPTVTPTYAETSTYLKGSFSCNFQSPSPNLGQVNHSSQVSPNKELIIDLCDGNYSTLTDNKILVIYDLSGSTARAGYVKNTNLSGESQIGIELLNFVFSAPSGPSIPTLPTPPVTLPGTPPIPGSPGTPGNNSIGVDCQFTDHNGFFFCASQAGGQGASYSINGYCGCKYISFTGEIDIGSNGGLQIDQWNLDLNTNCTSYDDPVLGICNYITITGQVLLCGGNVGVPHIGVVLSRGATATTDQNGNFTIIAHDDSTNTSQPRQDSIYLIASACAFTDCNGDCIQQISVVIQKCTTCAARTQSVGITLVEYIFLKGLLSGGTYPIGLTAWDHFGRPGFIQQLGNANIPPVYQTKVFAPAQVSIQIASGAVFPSWVSYITFWIAKETTIAEYIDWIVDSSILVDNTGLENTAAPTQIKIYYASLIEYNKQNNYNTTVNWSFLEPLPANAASGATQTPYTTDRVQFLMNGDGTFFSSNITSLVKYDQTGQYFLINYTPELANLIANARIRIYRPRVGLFTEGQENTAPYFELCSTIMVNARGIPASLSAILNAFDTYYIYRGIIPVPTAQPNTNPIVYVDEPRLEGIPFEHNSPSDFWGQGCANFGRVNINNDQETILFKKDEVTLSDTLSATGLLNFLCFFGDQPVGDFSDTDLNGIIAILPETGKVLIVGQNDHFIVGFNDNLGRINADGTFQAGSIPNTFGLPNIKVGQNWGCSLEDKNTIYKKEGLVHWLDRNKVAIIQHNYIRAFNVSKADPALGIPGGIDSWLHVKVKEVKNFNLQAGSLKRYFHGIVNPQGYEYIISDYTIGSNSPVNSERGPNVTMNETMSMDIFTKYWKGALGFTPELYAEIEGELTAQQLFSFWKGIPWSHYNDLTVKSYGQMFGITLVRVMEVVISIDKMAKKKPLSIGVICKQGQYFVDRAITEGGQRTRMLLSVWIQAVWGWYAPFLCDMNTPFDPNRPSQTSMPNVLFDGNMLVGDFIKTRLIGDPATDTTYTELEGVLTSVFKDGNNLVNK